MIMVYVKVYKKNQPPVSRKPAGGCVVIVMSKWSATSVNVATTHKTFEPYISPDERNHLLFTITLSK